MLGTYASLVASLAAATLIGQAVLVVAGRRQWSGIAPAIGLAALCGLAWGSVRLPGEGATAAIACGLVAALAAAYLAGRVEDTAGAVRRAAPIAIGAVVLASLPFIVEDRFGILGTGLNPDMSQHLFAVDRLADGASERLVADGYPLGPHAIVVAVATLGPSTVEAFGGLTLAIAAAACLAALELLAGLSAWRRIAGALCAGFAYLVAAYLVQGAVKETMQALFVVAFAVGLGAVAREWGRSGAPPLLRALPLGVIAIGSVYAYSFPGLLWLAGAAALWGAAELVPAAQRDRAEAGATLRAAVPAAVGALAVAAVGIAPELGRVVDFASFETFDPAGAGLGNLFNRLSPLEALGIWPSGDFRVEPGDGAVPAFVFYLGAAVGMTALIWGLRRALARRDRALPAALGAALALWLYALAGGTPYQEAKALVMVAAVVAVISVRGLVASRAPALVAIAFLAAAGGSSVLALVNGPVGPRGYSPELAALRDQLPTGSTVVEAPDEVLADQHGADFIAWELRGNRVCVESSSAPGDELPAAISARVTVGVDDAGAIVPSSIATGSTDEDATGGPCPLIPDAARADPSAGR
jgi:hypothetical protein